NLKNIKQRQTLKTHRMLRPLTKKKEKISQTLGNRRHRRRFASDRFPEKFPTFFSQCLGGLERYRVD
ncbi:MAG: hypothetical protein RR977_02120, partial [Oscillospiraceae bacterium]